MNNTKKLVAVSLLIAVQIVLARVASIEINRTIRLGFSFVALAINGALFGPLTAGISGAIADIIGVLLFPTGGFFPGFTLTAFINGCIYGFFLNKKIISIVDIVMACFGVAVVLLVLNSLWVSILIGKSYLIYVQARFIPEVIIFGINVLMLRILLPRIVYEGRKILSLNSGRV